MLRRKAHEAGPHGSAEAALSATTGLPDRSALPALLSGANKHLRETGGRTGLLLINIGHLRDVNDTYGPDTGDSLLRQVGERIANETGGGQEVLYYSAAEFALIAPGVETVDMLESLATGVFDLLGEPFPTGRASLNISASIGATLSTSEYRDEQQWIDDAHDALVSARELGNRGVVARDETTRNRVDVRITEDRIHKAVENNEFRLLYQPIVTVAGNDVVGVEALLRWHDPGATAMFISPGQFLPLLEKTGRIIEVGQWVIHEAARQTAEWNTRLDTELFACVNLGARQMAQTQLASTVSAALQANNLRPDLLTLDITPEALAFNRSAAWSELRELKTMGVRLALDDFGVGESTMQYLREIKVDLLRIHPTFVAGLGTTLEDNAIVKHLIGMGLDLEIISLAESVETAQQLEQLTEMRCGLAQGYYFGRPELPADLFEHL